MLYKYQERSRLHRRSSFFGSLFKLFGFFILVMVIFVVSLFLLKSFRKPPSHVLADTVVSPLGKPSKEPSGNSKALANVVTSSLAGTKGTYAVAIKNLTTGETYLQNEHLVYEAASLYKLWIMVTVFDQIKSGKIQESTSMKSSAENLNKKFDIASEAAELKEGEVEMSVAEALEKMITISHNYAALLLSEKVRLSNVNAQLLSYGLTESTLNPPKVTAFDMLKFFELLYNRELVDSKYSETMTTLLERQQLNDRIPKYLPTDISVAHKTGELDDFKHDAGIVYTNNGDYIIVILSRSADVRAAAEREAELSRDIYHYFQRK